MKTDQVYSIPSIFFESVKNSVSCFIKPYTNAQKVDKAQILMETHVLSFLLEGEKSVILPDSKVTFQNDSFILLKKGNCLMTEKLSGEGGFKSLLIFFDNDYLLRFFKKYNLALSSASTDRGFSVLQKDDLLNSIAYSLLPYFDSKKDLPESISELKAEELLLQIVDLYGTESVSFLLDHLQAYRDIAFKKVVESNITNNLNSSQLAFLCNMSPSTFRRKFIQFYGETPGKWFTKKRLEKAAQLLKSSDANASEIYLKVGFESLSSFIHAFKKAYGATPKKYQNS
ncbi:helix-turn-helix domain-containing protein [Cyclobacterium roseum]|uniref:helix-turn-helix domain-containing protein n=1 Tax=Cyclobacterium roseum TaxID=2666137 RepID=UPI001390C6EC|nr:helix-turn-helix domain-containing protein [Cyclobacterium roseum]